MSFFRDITTARARSIDRTMMSMARLETVDELECRFMEIAGRILPADCFCWNNWSRDMSHLQTFSINDNYSECFNGLLDVFADVVGSHPVIAAGKLGDTVREVMRMSDFETASRFRENPLFREVYRHLDSHYQISFTASVLYDRRLVLTWNRRSLDFTDQDVQVFQYLGMRLGMVSRRVEERQMLDAAWKGLCGFIDPRLGAGSVESLGEQDGRVLAELLKSRPRDRIASEMGVRRDSLDKRLGAIRERLGLENHHQLLSALAALRDTGKPETPVSEN
ncbi:MAG: hypothetical protein EOP88_18050 [Verrucomicrobiaceae bacterium]|nr:MAG: hypothetical protein EOP88_18050 [Verrucomicrobiaceae bacterium]